MNIMRSFSVFCSYKLEFYHERLSVSQKARIKHEYIYVKLAVSRKAISDLISGLPFSGAGGSLYTLSVLCEEVKELR